MADKITVRDSSKSGSFAPHPEGTFASVCVDVIDLGERVEKWQDEEKLSYKIALVFDAGEKNPETGDSFLIHPEFTASMNERASLRAFLESWRGRGYTKDEAHTGIPVDKLVGAKALITVEHKVSGAGRTYAKVRGVSPLPKVMPAPDVNGYKRPDFWAQRKEEYARAVALWKEMHASRQPLAQAPIEGMDEYPAALRDEDPDGIPF